MMKGRTLIHSLALALLLFAISHAQVGGTAVLQAVRTSSQNFRTQVGEGGADVNWTGLGLVSGDMVDMELVNNSNSPKEFKFVPGMILQDPGSQVQPIALEESLTFTLQPGESVKRRMRGYCLDFTKDPPAAGSQEDYEVAEDPGEYMPAVESIYRGLELNKNQRFRPVLRPLTHRTIVTQRAIWAVLGGDNPGTQEELKEEIEKEIRRGSTIFPSGQIDCLARRIWNDVQQVMGQK